MQPRKVVEDALDTDFPQWQQLPPHLTPAFTKHFEDLISLATALDAAGRDMNVIRTLVTNLLKGYGADLLAAIEDRV